MYLALLGLQDHLDLQGLVEYQDHQEHLVLMVLVVLEVLLVIPDLVGVMVFLGQHQVLCQ